jgi:diaminohydroxyphosphoribosylaminopyrimidine deaminase/5-amino-6-(5-phosphoribosylamino)uracil reductase
MVDVRRALSWLAQKGITHLLVEGGGKLASSFVEKDLVDDVVWFLAPKMIGGETARTAVAGLGLPLAKARQLKDVQFVRVGQDLCIRGRIH